MFLPNEGAGRVNASFFDPKQEKDAQRKKLLAELLVKQGNEKLKNEVAGGMTVARSPWENINQGAQKYIGEFQMGKADDELAKAEQRRQDMIAEALGSGDQMAAARVLAQDPNTSESAVKLYQDALRGERERELFGMKLDRDDANYQREADLMRLKLDREDKNWEREASLKRELANMRNRSGGVGMTIDPDTGEITQGFSNKPLPVGALKLQQEALDALAAAQGITEKTEALKGQLDTGQLDVGPIDNLISRARNFAGRSSQNSINFQNLETDLEKIRNDSLRLNKGVQTEGDAQRAMEEVIRSKNDPKALAAAMEKLQAINERAVELQKVQINNIRGNYNASPFDFDQVGSLPSSVPPSMNNQASGVADKVRSHLAQKGMNPQQIEAFIQQRGIK